MNKGLGEAPCSIKNFIEQLDVGRDFQEIQEESMENSN